jgi:hypothetical protein
MCVCVGLCHSWRSRLDLCLLRVQQVLAELVSHVTNQLCEHEEPRESARARAREREREREREAILTIDNQEVTEGRSVQCSERERERKSLSGTKLHTSHSYSTSPSRGKKRKQHSLVRECGAVLTPAEGGYTPTSLGDLFGVAGGGE